MIAATLATTAASAACEMPSLVRPIPDGATATETELLAVQAEVRAYVREMDAYIACTNEELTAGRLAAEGLTEGEQASTAEFLYWMTERIALARSEVDAVATRFNEQVRAYRAANRIAEPARPALPPGGLTPGSTRDETAPPSGAPATETAPAGPPRFND